MAKRKYTAKTADLHELYEKSVQCEKADLDFVNQAFCERKKPLPHVLKEDFCGTAALAVEFVRRHKDNRAIGVDLDADTLAWGRERNVAKLGDRVDRVTLKNANVLDVTEPEVDVVVAMNFSYFVFKERTDLLSYFRTAHESLAPGGLFILDAYGGSDAQVPQKEKRKQKGFTYVWDQHDFNPITNEVVNYIHFHFPDGTKLKRAFTYDWRLWTPREIAETLEEAGFSHTDVYWEGWDEDEEEGDGNFERATQAENCEGWVVYIVAET